MSFDPKRCATCCKDFRNYPRDFRGRFIFGVAGGFIREAMENHGSIFQDRWEIVENSFET